MKKKKTAEDNGNQFYWLSSMFGRQGQINLKRNALLEIRQLSA
ncbi:hypothetical protein NC99_37480 [Sunxiuqinia dokdonensis]|uniref:Uncharacterized protein n=1 Tax=Sunxiuqinia dokdonensis TaxID=1409788 RepID=A0A0L8V4V6_9BACT|nr:hypothetical protein NC99_37480 [Sunxiuqinia dokdonensis]